MKYSLLIADKTKILTVKMISLHYVDFTAIEMQNGLLT